MTSAGGAKPMASGKEEAAKAYWKENVRLLITLLIIWFVVAYGLGIILAPVLNNIVIAGYPLGFWFAQQGSIYIFIALIFTYVFKMNALDRKYDVHEE
jgi:putative solute:sodium symporter small subunit